MVTILVTGATGRLGSRVARRLLDAGADVRALSRHPPSRSAGLEPVAGDLLTGEGLSPALKGVQVIVHCATDNRHDVEASRTLLARVAAGDGRPHVVYPSIVGVDRLSFGYTRAKLEVEGLVQASGLPWSIIRATQFFDYCLSGLRAITRLPIVPIPSGVVVKPIDPDEVAVRLAEVALGPPAGRVPDISGPQVIDVVEMERMYLRATHRRRAVVSFPLPGSAMRAIRAGALLPDPGSAEPGGRGRTWEAFLASTVS